LDGRQYRQDQARLAEVEKHVQALEARNAEQARGQQRLSTNLDQRDDKIRRMQQSFSWQVTAPLRWLRRCLLDRHRRSA